MILFIGVIGRSEGLIDRSWWLDLLRWWWLFHDYFGDETGRHDAMIVFILWFRDSDDLADSL